MLNKVRWDEIMLSKVRSDEVRMSKEVLHRLLLHLEERHKNGNRLVISLRRAVVSQTSV